MSDFGFRVGEDLRVAMIFEKGFGFGLHFGIRFGRFLVQCYPQCPFQCQLQPQPQLQMQAQLHDQLQLHARSFKLSHFSSVFRFYIRRLFVGPLGSASASVSDVPVPV